MGSCMQLSDGVAHCLMCSVEEFTDYDSVVVFLAVRPAYNAKFFVISH